MSSDLDTRHPRPWRTIAGRGVLDANDRLVVMCAEIDIAEKIVSLANADEIQRRQGLTALPEWSVYDGTLAITGWHVVDHTGRRIKGYLVTHSGPADALIAAEAWLTSQLTSTKKE